MGCLQNIESKWVVSEGLSAGRCSGRLFCQVPPVFWLAGCLVDEDQVDGHGDSCGGEEEAQDYGVAGDVAGAPGAGA